MNDERVRVGGVDLFRKNEHALPPEQRRLVMDRLARDCGFIDAADCKRTVKRLRLIFDGRRP